MQQRGRRKKQCVSRSLHYGQVQMQSAGHFGHCANSVNSKSSKPTGQLRVPLQIDISKPSSAAALRVTAPRTNRGFTLLAPLLLPLQNTLNRSRQNF